MISIILTAWKEERSVGDAVRALITSARELDDEFELILVCPDKGTRVAAEEVVGEMGCENFTYVQDPQKGKPHALNLARKKVGGDIIVSTDGDVVVEEGALANLLDPLSDDTIGGVTGRPICENDRSTMWGYWGHMFMDAAHQRREETLGNGKFFVMSGYLLAMRNLDWDIPDGVLDDVFFSYFIHDKGLRIAYAPDARVFVKQPSNTRDWVKQKVRSLAGHHNLQGHFAAVPGSRSFLGDVAYAFYPLTYARSPKELWWSILQYPFRTYVWIATWWNTRVRNRKAMDVWERTESTK